MQINIQDDPMNGIRWLGRHPGTIETAHLQEYDVLGLRSRASRDRLIEALTRRVLRREIISQ